MTFETIKKITSASPPMTLLDLEATIEALSRTLKKEILTVQDMENIHNLRLILCETLKQMECTTPEH